MNLPRNLIRRRHSADDNVRRVVAARSTVLRCAVSLVVDRKSSEVTLDEIAAASELPVTTVALFFRDPTELLVEAALDLARVEILPQYLDRHAPASGPATSAFALHFHRHREFYVVMQSGASAPALNVAFDDLFSYFNALNVRAVLGPNAPIARVDAASLAITIAARDTVRSWLLDESANHSAETLYALLEKVMSDLIASGSTEGEARPGTSVD